jgi:hypothetical protein
MGPDVRRDDGLYFGGNKKAGIAAGFFYSIFNQ